MKRVIILASIVVFKTTITPLGALGSGITILGAMLYALAKNKYKTVPAVAAPAAEEEWLARRRGAERRGENAHARGTDAWSSRVFY